MIVFKNTKDVSNYLDLQKKKEVSIGFVPTMGALHQGHLSLLRSAKKENKLCVSSIFVNPAQFNNADDFKQYPVSIEKDIELLISNGCDVLFLPSNEQVYAPGYTPQNYDLGILETRMEGHYRPGHFQGVCQVVDRLLSIVNPNKLYVGQKDYQQCQVIKKLIEITNRQNEIKLVMVPTVRENDGLAMSSRNLRLSAEQRKLAPAIFDALLTAKYRLTEKPISDVKNQAFSILTAKGFKVDYFEIANADTLAPSNNTKNALIGLVAAYVGNIRLIDNLPLN